MFSAFIFLLLFIGISFITMVGVCLIIKIWTNDWPEYLLEKKERKK